MSDARARAEARRQRILKGGAARLAAIAGRELNDEERRAVAAEPLAPSTDTIDDARAFSRDEPLVEPAACPRFPPPRVAEPPPPPSTLSELASSRLHVALYSIVVQTIFLAAAVESYLFLPLLLWELVELLYVEAQKPKLRTGGELPALRMLRVAQTAAGVFKDACVYLFAAVAFRLALHLVGADR